MRVQNQKPTFVSERQISRIKNSLFKDKVFKDFSVIPSLEKQVDDGKSAEEVLKNYFNSLDK